MGLLLLLLQELLLLLLLEKHFYGEFKSYFEFGFLFERVVLVKGNRGVIEDYCQQLFVAELDRQNPLNVVQPVGLPVQRLQNFVLISNELPQFNVEHFKLQQFLSHASLAVDDRQKGIPVNALLIRVPLNYLEHFAGLALQVLTQHQRQLLNFYKLLV